MSKHNVIPAHAGIHCAGGLGVSSDAQLPSVDPGVRRDDRSCVSLNGCPLDTTAPTLQALLTERGYDLGAAFACALNSVFVPRSQWPLQALRDGDRVDVITPVTGG